MKSMNSNCSCYFVVSYVFRTDTTTSAMMKKKQPSIDFIDQKKNINYDKVPREFKSSVSKVFSCSCFQKQWKSYLVFSVLKHVKVF